MNLVTLTCRSCSMEPVRDTCDEGKDPLATGLLAGIASRHMIANPDHEIYVHSETPEQVAAREAKERAAGEEETRRSVAAYKKRNAASAARARIIGGLRGRRN